MNYLKVLCLSILLILVVSSCSEVSEPLVEDVKQQEQKLVETHDYLNEKIGTNGSYSLAAPIGVSSKEADIFLDFNRLSTLEKSDLQTIIEHSSILAFLSDQEATHLLNDVSKGSLLSKQILDQNIRLKGQYEHYQWDGKNNMSNKTDRSHSCSGWWTYLDLDYCYFCGCLGTCGAQIDDGIKRRLVRQKRSCKVRLPPHYNYYYWTDYRTIIDSHSPCGGCTIYY